MSQRILDKIKKLLALAASGNQYEAANAMAKVQALMAAHGLTSLDVELSGIAEHGAKSANGSVKQPVWHLMLITLVLDAFGVEMFMRRGRFGQPGQVVFIGPSERAEIASYVYDVLARQLAKARKDYLKSLSKRMKISTKVCRADKFCEGWSYAVRAKVQRLVPSGQEQALVKQYMAHHHTNLQTAKSRPAGGTRRDDKAGIDGYHAGSEVELNAGVGGREQEKLGIA